MSKTHLDAEKIFWCGASGFRRGCILSALISAYWSLPPPAGVSTGVFTGALIAKLQGVPLPLGKLSRPQPSTLNPQPFTPQPSTLDPQPSTLNPQPSTLNPQPSTLNLRPSTLSPQPSTLNPQPSTLNPYP
jgi:hypothetical protein